MKNPSYPIHFVIMLEIFWKQHFMVFLLFSSISFPSILHFFFSFMCPSILLACLTAGSTVKSFILYCCYASDPLYNHWSDYPVDKSWLDVPHNVKLVPSGSHTNGRYFETKKFCCHCLKIQYEDILNLVLPSILSMGM